MIHLVTRLPLPYHQTLCRTLHDGLNGNFCAWFAERYSDEWPFKASSLQFHHHYLTEVGYVRFWRALREKRKPAVILGGWSSPMTKKTLLMTSALRIPVFVWADHPHPRSLMSRTLRASYLRLLSRGFVQGFLVCGNATGEYLAALGIPRRTIHNFPYWVELPEQWSPPSGCSSPGPRRRPLRVLAIGRHVAGKNFNVAIRAVKLANERARSALVELVLVGDGPERTNLERLAASLEMDGSAWFKGWLENDRVQEELAGCDALVFPSEFEGYGVVAREALAHGRPVLCSNGVVAALDETIKSNAILLHPVGDLEALADHMSLLASDIEVLRKASEEARKLAEKWPPLRALSILQHAIHNQRGHLLDIDFSSTAHRL